MLDLKDQLKNFFPEHKFEEQKAPEKPKFWLQDEPILCKYEKRNGKPTTILQGYNGAKDDFKKLDKYIKTKLSVGGSIKDETIILQGDYRDKIMQILQEIGFKVKRVGG